MARRKKKLGPLSFLRLKPEGVALLRARRAPSAEVTKLQRLAIHCGETGLGLLKEGLCICAAIHLKNGRRAAALKAMRRAQRGGFTTDPSWMETYEKCRKLVPETRYLLYDAVIAEYSEVREFNTGISGPSETDTWPDEVLKVTYDAASMQVLSAGEFARRRMPNQDLDVVGQYMFELPFAPSAFGASSEAASDNERPCVRYVCVQDPETREGVLIRHFSGDAKSKSKFVFGGRPQDHIREEMLDDQEAKPKLEWKPQLWKGEGYYDHFGDNFYAGIVDDDEVDPSEDDG